MQSITLTSVCPQFHFRPIFDTSRPVELSRNALTRGFIKCRFKRHSMVTATEVEEAQRAWGDGIVDISAAHSSGEDFVGLAKNHIDTLYAYEMSPVLFNRPWQQSNSSVLLLREHFRISQHQMEYALKTMGLPSTAGAKSVLRTKT